MLERVIFCEINANLTTLCTSMYNTFTIVQEMFSICETVFTFFPLDYSEKPKSLFLFVGLPGQKKTVKSKVYYKAMILWLDLKSEEVRT